MSSPNASDSPTAGGGQPGPSDAGPIADAIADGDYEVAVETLPGVERDLPVSWTVDVVDTAHGPMLALSAPEFVVEPRYYRERPNGTYVVVDPETADPSAPDVIRQVGEVVRVSVRVTPETAVDARTPLPAEPTLAPKLGLRETVCPNPGPDPTRPGKTCYRYESRAYARFDGPDDAYLDVVVRATGTDRRASRVVSYLDVAYARFDAHGEGWRPLDGQLTAGMTRRA